MACHLLAIALLAVLFLYFVRRLRPGNISSNHGSKVVLITGCDSGFGNAAARNLDGLGFNVIACCLDKNGKGSVDLREKCSHRLRVVQLDLTDDEQLEKCHEVVASMCDKLELWALINNAALTNYISEVEYMPIKIVKKVFDVNVHGVLKLTKKFLPLLKVSKGRIINISSLTATMHLKTLSAYSASKSALETFSDCLRQELKPCGIDVIVIRPSGFKTEGLDSSTIEERFKELWSEIKEESNADFDDIFEHLKDLTEQFRRKALKGCEDCLEPVIDVIKDAVLSSKPRKRYNVGRGALVMSLICNLLPTTVVDFVQSML